MKIHLLISISSVKEHNIHESLMKTLESNIRPIEGDLIDDPGFHHQFHNGYEVVKVTINYASNECWVSLAPIAREIEEINIQTYMKKLIANGWRVVSKEELQT